MRAKDWEEVAIVTLGYTVGMFFGHHWYSPMLFAIGCIFGLRIFDWIVKEK